jgi:hypothetical protein
MYTGQPSTLLQRFPLFAKSASKYKSFADIVKDISVLPYDIYQFSEVVKFSSEWRASVHRGRLQGVQNYSGNFTSFPDIEFIEQLIESYTDAPLSYTLDIGKTGNRWAVVEVHPFVSCGLYGFHSGLLPRMMINGFNWMLENGRKVNAPFSKG